MNPEVVLGHDGYRPGFRVDSLAREPGAELLLRREDVVLEMREPYELRGVGAQIRWQRIGATPANANTTLARGAA